MLLCVSILGNNMKTLKIQVKNIDVVAGHAPHILSILMISLFVLSISTSIFINIINTHPHIDYSVYDCIEKANIYITQCNSFAHDTQCKLNDDIPNRTIKPITKQKDFQKDNIKNTIEKYNISQNKYQIKDTQTIYHCQIISFIGLIKTNSSEYT